VGDRADEVLVVVDFLLASLTERPQDAAVVWNGRTFSNAWLLERYRECTTYLSEKGIDSGKVIGLEGDFTPTSIAMLLAGIEGSVIVAPFAAGAKGSDEAKYAIAQLEALVAVNTATDGLSYRELPGRPDHPFYAGLRSRSAPGLVLFTSGTAGQPKAAVHDFSRLLAKFRTKRPSLRTLSFLLFDHWGGLNTLFHTLSNGGTVLTTRDRSPDAVCALIEEHRVELLPASPTFFNLLLLSEAHRRHDLSSLKVITYGTEPMPASTLDRLRRKFPRVKLQQTYGLIELGVLRSKSKSDDSLFMKVGGEGYETRVVDGILQIRAASAMLGYLNAPSPFTEDGFFVTGDRVEVDGEYLRVLGRDSELINVGGEKVYPQEVEDAVLRFDNVADVVVYGEKNPLTGSIVCAAVTQRRPESREEFVPRLKRFLRSLLPGYKVPVKIAIEDDIGMSARFKKGRALRRPQ
jgi:long-chain acyl-CoA synthetase